MHQLYHADKLPSSDDRVEFLIKFWSERNSVTPPSDIETLTEFFISEVSQ